MIRNYFKTALRTIVRHKSFSLLNIFGLSLGMACSILIFSWVADELSFDKFNSNAKEIYRITSNITDSKAAVIPIPMAMDIKKTIPGVNNVTRLKKTGSIFTIYNRKFEEKRGYYADSNLLRMFSYPLVEGNINEALTRPDGILITASLAQKYFGTTDAIGKTIISDNDIKTNSLVVTGVLKDIPANSHLQFDFLIPISLYEKHIDFDGSWGNFDLYTYVQMDHGFKSSPTNISSINKKLFDLFSQHDNEHSKGEFSIQSLTDIHLRSDQLLLDVDGQGSIEYVRIFSLVAIFIILIACINFMNLSTAMSGLRAKEVGLRKTIGALRGQLIAQFLGESVMLSLVSLVIGIAMTYILLPYFNQLTTKNISLDLIDIKIVSILIGSGLVVGLLAGFYPAFFLSAFKPIKVLKGLKILPNHKAFFRNGLVVLQFSISMILIVGTLVVYHQLRFIRNRDIGFNKENLMYIKMPQVGDLGNNYQALKSTLNQYPGISDYTIINYLPANLTTGTTDVIWPEKDSKLQVIFPHLGVDENFMKTFGIHLITGRFFARDFQGDRNNYVVNETALQIMKWSPASAIGKSISVNGRKGEIVGVIKDFNFKSVHQVIEPLILKYNGSGGQIVLRTTPATMVNLLSQMKKVFRNVYADHPFSYGFVDEEISKLYTSEKEMVQLFNVFATLSVMVSCLGLFGLATYAAQQRIKEVGVRKVLGASVRSIVSMLSKDFMKPVVVAVVIAFPIAWWLMSQWLQGFAYRVNIDWSIFAIAGGISLLVAFATISFQAIKAAVSNPIKSLRTE